MINNTILTRANFEQILTKTVQHLQPVIHKIAEMRATYSTSYEMECAAAQVETAIENLEEAIKVL